MVRGWEMKERIKPPKYSYILSPLSLEVSIKPKGRVSADYQIIRPLLWAGSSGYLLGATLCSRPTYSFFVTITRNPKPQESCSPKLKEVRCCGLVLLNRLAHLCISSLIVLTAQEYPFTFSLHSLACFPQ